MRFFFKYLKRTLKSLMLLLKSLKIYELFLMN